MGPEIWMSKYLYRITTSLDVFINVIVFYENFMVEMFHTFEQGTAKEIRHRDEGA